MKEPHPMQHRVAVFTDKKISLLQESRRSNTPATNKPSTIQFSWDYRDFKRVGTKERRPAPPHHNKTFCEPVAAQGTPPSQPPPHTNTNKFFTQGN